MKILRHLFILAGTLAAASAHPMGNFSVSHYTRFDVHPSGLELTYVLDLAEIPTFELLQTWNLNAADRAAILSRARRQGREWLPGLSLTGEGRILRPEFRQATARLTDGAAGMPVLRVEVSAYVPSDPSSIQFDDRNYPGRAGWKEIVVVPHSGATLVSTTSTAQDRTDALRNYPADATTAPPQETRASFQWSAPVPVQVAGTAPPQGIESIVTGPAPRFSEQQQTKAMGTVVRGDFLSRMLGGREITLWMMVIGLCVAFGLGAAHALSPGHGKTIVAAYLVGSRGTMTHALFLGGMVTFTHTISVFALGLAMLAFERYVVPEQVIPALGAISGLSIVAIGSMLLYQRTKWLAGGSHSHSHEYPHSHDHHPHDHHPHDHHHHHDHHHPHSHVPQAKITLAGLIALGASGGLVPCPSALILLLSAIALGRTGLGLLLLVAFSAGLALVLMAIGVIVLYAKNLLPERVSSAIPALRYVPVFSAVAIVVLGLMMTGVSAGWIRPGIVGG